MIIEETNSQFSSILDETFRPMPDQVRWMVGLLDDDEQFAWRIWWCPDDSNWMFKPAPVEKAYDGSYLQAGGTAEKMSVELRHREDDGEFRF